MRPRVRDPRPFAGPPPSLIVCRNRAAYRRRACDGGEQRSPRRCSGRREFRARVQGRRGRFRSAFSRRRSPGERLRDDRFRTRRMQRCEQASEGCPRTGEFRPRTDPERTIVGIRACRERHGDCRAGELERCAGPDRPTIYDKGSLAHARTRARAGRRFSKTIGVCTWDRAGGRRALFGVTSTPMGPPAHHVSIRSMRGGPHRGEEPREPCSHGRSRGSE